MPRFSAKRAAFPGVGEATPRTVAAGTCENPSKWASAMKPEPTSPMPTSRIAPPYRSRPRTTGGDGGAAHRRGPARPRRRHALRPVVGRHAHPGPHARPPGDVDAPVLSNTYARRKPARTAAKARGQDRRLVTHVVGPSTALGHTAARARPRALRADPRDSARDHRVRLGRRRRDPARTRPVRVPRRGRRQAADGTPRTGDRAAVR